ncbi:hypothetical protein JW935_08610 [candidate division KSB1 bacterium]|nr:hypothetical protein [candidate division KSB1 bacterium]
MKINKVACVCIVILFIFLTAAISQELPKSFRNEATGTALVDELDLVYDPIEISFVDSVRLFTNLSNMVSTDEEFMNNSSDNTFLFGISAPAPIFKKMHTSLLVKYNNYTTPRDVKIDRDMDGFFDVSGEGDLEDKFIAYSDTDYDGLFDLKRQFDQEAHNNRLNRQHQVWLTGSLPVGNLVVGGRFGMGKTVTETQLSPRSMGKIFLYGQGVDVSDPSFFRQMLLVNLENDSLVDSYTEQGDFEGLESSDFIGFALSAMKILNMPWGKTEGRIDAGFQKFTDEFSSSNHYSFHKNDFPVETAYYSNSDKLTRMETSSEKDITVGASLKRIFRPMGQRRYDGYWRVGVHYTYGFGKWEDSEKTPRFEHTFAPPSMPTNPTGYDSTFQELVHRETAEMVDEGDISLQSLFVSANTQIPLNNKVTFGMGMSYHRRSYSYETEITNFTRNETLFEVLDDTSTIEDFTQIRDQSVGYDNFYKYQRCVFNVPVGLEYVFTKNSKWRIRFGALFSFHKTITDDVRNVTNTQPSVTRKETGDGEVTVDINLNDSEYASTGEHIEDIYTQTVYTYGLGFYPTSNLQIDLLGFWGKASNTIFDTEFWRCLRLSMTVRL